MGVIIGVVVFMVVTFAASMATGPLIHEGVLDPHYRATESFWQPALAQDPPDMAAMMPTWLFNSLVVSLIVAWLYCRFRGFHGTGWKRGANFGFSVGLLVAGIYLAMSGVFHLPSQIWVWWAVEGLILYVVGGAATGCANHLFMTRGDRYRQLAFEVIVEQVEQVRGASAPSGYMPRASQALANSG